MKRGLSVIVLLVAAALATAQQVTVAYVEGSVQFQDGRAWIDLYVGDPLSATDTVRLAEGAYLEIRAGSATVRLTRAGTYAVRDLVSSSERTQTAGLGGVVLQRIGRVHTPQRPTQTAAGGVRASEAVANTGPSWVGGEPVGELIVQGAGKLAEGDYQEGYSLLEEAYEYASTASEEAAAAFYFGYASSLVGRFPRALELLTEIGPDPETEFYATHVLALGQLLVESFSYPEAIDYLTALAADDASSPEDRQYAELLLGVAFDGMGMTAQARTYLQSARSRLPGTPAATAAQELLGNL